MTVWLVWYRPAEDGDGLVRIFKDKFLADNFVNRARQKFPDIPGLFVDEWMVDEDVEVWT